MIAARIAQNSLAVPGVAADTRRPDIAVARQMTTGPRDCYTRPKVRMSSSKERAVSEDTVAVVDPIAWI